MIKGIIMILLFMFVGGLLIEVFAGIVRMEYELLVAAGVVVTCILLFTARYKGNLVMWVLFVAFSLVLYLVYVPFLESRGFGFEGIFDIALFFIPLLAFSASIPAARGCFGLYDEVYGSFALLGMVIANTIILASAGSGGLLLIVGFGFFSVIASGIGVAVGGRLYGSHLID